MDWWDCGAGRMRMGGELVEPSVAHVEGAADYRRTSTGEGRGGGDWLKGLSLRRRAVGFRGARVGSELGRAKR